jgi:predicted dehydrogenase
MSFLHYRGSWMKEWYCKKELAGESIAVIETCHYIDLMRFWSGDEVAWVFATATAHNLRSEYEYPDTSFCQMGFKNGMIANIVDSHAVAADRFKNTETDSGKSYATTEGEFMDPVYGHRFEYTIIGTKGTLLVNMFAKTISVITEDYVSENGRPQLGLKRVEDYNKQSMHDLVHDHTILDNLFIDSIKNNKPAVFSPEDALKTHQVVFAIEASEKQSKKIKLQI